MPDVNLGPHFERFVQDQLNAGRFQNASEVIRAGLRLHPFERRAMIVHRLRAGVMKIPGAHHGGQDLAALTRLLGG